jgi:hypothetical protein
MNIRFYLQTGEGCALYELMEVKNAGNRQDSLTG